MLGKAPFLAIAATAVLGLLPAPAAATPPAHGATAFRAATLDPTRFVQAVLDKNPDVKAEAAAHRAALARVTSAGALDDPVVAYSGAPQTPSTTLGYRQSIQLSQRIPWPGVLSLRAKAAAEDAGSVADQLADTRLRLAARARAAYADWYYVHRALAINAADLALVDHLKAVARAAYANGQAPQQDVLRAEVERLRLDNQTLELHQREAAVRAEIDSLLDAPPDAPVPPPGDLPQPPVAGDLQTLSGAALAHNPALRGWNTQVAANRDQVELAHDSFFPNFTLLAGQNQLMDPRQKQITVGVAINIPIGAKHSGDLHEAYARLDQTQQRFLAARDRLLADLGRTYAALRQLHATVALYDKHLVPVADLNLRAAEADYGNGSGDFTKLIAAEQQVLTLSLERERARADYFIQYASLAYQTGGAGVAGHQGDTTP